MNGNKSICSFWNSDTLEEDANLIVDAFKVRQQINCELSELLQQRNEMLAMLELLVKNCNDSNRNDTIEDADELIKKVKDNE
jgi:predicted Zn-dependent peptidase